MLSTALLHGVAMMCEGSMAFSHCHDYMESCLKFKTYMDFGIIETQQLETSQEDCLLEFCVELNPIPWGFAPYSNSEGQIRVVYPKDWRCY